MPAGRRSDRRRRRPPRGASWGRWALYELLNVDVYDLLGLEVNAYDTAPCPLEVLRVLRRPLERVLGRRDLAHWNDHGCPGPAAAEQLLRAAAATAARSCDWSRS